MAKIYAMVVYVTVWLWDNGNSAEDYGDPMVVLDLSGLDEVPGSDGLEDCVDEGLEEAVDDE